MTANHKDKHKKSDKKPVVRRKKKYKIREEIGQGGMGVVFRATRYSDNKDIALKVIRPEFLRQHKTMVRFQREIRALVRLKHKHLVAIYDYRLTPDSKPYLAMEYVDGADLYCYVKEKGALSHSEIVRISCELASAVKYIHSHNMIHRDLKPRNILLTKSGKVKVSDFGLSKQFDLTPITDCGVQIGTPRYMAPEVVKGATVDHRSDIYQLGLLMYYMATGEVAHRGKAVVEVMKKIVAGDIILPSMINDSIHPELEKIILRCLQRQPEKRYRHAGLLLEALQNFDQQHRDSGYKFAGRDRAGITAYTTGKQSLSGHGKEPVSSSDVTVDLSNSSQSSNSRLAKILLPVFALLLIATVIFFIPPDLTRTNAMDQNVTISIDTSPKTALIQWESDIPYVSRILYKLAGSMVEARSGTFQSPEEVTHKVLLENLKTDSKYSFQILFSDDSKSTVHHFETKKAGIVEVHISEEDMVKLDNKIRVEFDKLLSVDLLILSNASEYLLGLKGKHVESAVIPYLKNKNRVVRAMAVKVLANVFDNSGIRYVLPLLIDPFAEVRGEVVRFCTKHGRREDLELLIPFLRNTMSRSRIAGLEAIAGIGGPKSLSLIFSMTRDEDFKVKIGAISLMARKDAGRYVPLLVQQMNKEKTIIGIASYLTTLGKIADLQASVPVRRFLGAPDILIKAEAMMALARIEGERAIAVLERFLSVEEEAVVLAAVDALGEVDSPKGVFVLRQFMKGKSGKTLRRSVRAIGRIPGKEALSFLEGALKSNNDIIKADAILASGERELTDKISFFKMMLKDEAPVIQVAAMISLASLKVFEAEEEIRAAGKNTPNPRIEASADHSIGLLHGRSLLAIDIRCTTVSVDGTIVVGRIANE